MASVKRSIVRRDTQLLADGTYTFRDQLDIEGTVTTTVVTGIGWLVEYFESKGGELSFSSGDTTVYPRGAKCWVFYPPFSLSRPFLRGFRGTVAGKASTDPLRPEFTGKPLLFESRASILEAHIGEILASATNKQSIDLNPLWSRNSMAA